MAFFYRGTGGLLATYSPWVVGIVLRYPLQYIFHFDWHFLLGDRLWSNGLAMFLGGLLTVWILFRLGSFDGATETAAGTHEYAPAATVTAVLGTATIVQEESQSPTLDDNVSEEEPFGNDDEALKVISSNISAVQPFETDAAENDDIHTVLSATRLGTIVRSLRQWLRQLPPHRHHLCFLSTDRIAMVWMVLGILCIVLDPINCILSPLGGIMNVLAWTFILSSVYCLCWMVCGPLPTDLCCLQVWTLVTSIATCVYYIFCAPLPADYHDTQLVSSEEEEAPEASSGDKTLPGGEATDVNMSLPVTTDAGITAAKDDALQTPSMNDEIDKSSLGGNKPKEIV